MLSAPMTARLRMSLAIGAWAGRRLLVGAPYTMARLIERRFVPTIHFGNLGGVLFSSPVSFNRPT